MWRPMCVSEHARHSRRTRVKHYDGAAKLLQEFISCEGLDICTPLHVLECVVDDVKLHV